MKWKEPTFDDTPMIKVLAAANARRKANEYDYEEEQNKLNLTYPDWAKEWIKKYKEAWYIAEASGDRIAMNKAKELADALRDKLRKMTTMPEWAQQQMQKQTLRWMEANEVGNVRVMRLASEAEQGIEDKLRLIESMKQKWPDDAKTLNDLTAKWYYVDDNEFIPNEDREKYASPESAKAEYTKQAQEIIAKFEKPKQEEKKEAANIEPNKVANEPAKGTGKAIIDNLRNDTSLGLSKEINDAMINIATALLNEGYEPAFVAGVLGNIMAEGSPGMFESSAYITNPRSKPDYLKYMDENHDYSNVFSGKNISEVGIKKTYAVLKELEKGGYVGKFGLGSVQWTGGRTMGLIQSYIELYGEDYYPTKAESLIAENKMIVKELNGDYYNKRVYQDWKSQYGNSNGSDAAYGAGSIVTYKYEIPHDTDKQAKIRANNAKNVYKVMMGSN
ncbi:hypothetical protein C8Z91_08205 [Paenibacillus elgii]|uniref:Phage tail lysozyme domain-containing protein n=1 Tax=Paenibacillus elgii TaxID=189691 RepID=A0A2T6G5K0_9BACL|nr:phage tail tip lysozyme [Paenibacillus elgii]PUA39402.1 hypothetical protein C8Z91_08205 [Paenibacillus elgii]